MRVVSGHFFSTISRSSGGIFSRAGARGARARGTRAKAGAGGKRAKRGEPSTDAERAWKGEPGGAIDYTVPTLATSWELAPDLSTVTITTRTGVKFHNGWGEMTASDVAWGYDHVNPAITPHAST